MTSRWPMHGGQMRAIAERLGVAEEGLVDFSANINPEGPPESAWVALRECLEDARVLTTYPDMEEVRLRGALARAAGVRLEEVAVGNGFAPMFEAALRSAGVRSCLLPVPCFGEYRRVLEAVGVGVAPMVLRAEDGFQYDLRALQRRVEVEGHDCVVLANPQNPSGAVCDAGQMLGLLTWADARGVRVMLDEAFIDYVPEASLTSRVVSMRGVTVFRSVTKFYAVPGLRVSYAVGGAAAMRQMAERIAPWAVTTMASRVVEAIVGDSAYAERTRDLNATRRAGLTAGLRALGMRVFPGAANFLLVQLLEEIGARDGSEMWERLIREHGMVVRQGATFEGLPPGCFRLAVRQDGENASLLQALQMMHR